MTDVNAPKMTYEEIEADIESRGFTPRDLLNQNDHFDRWRRRNRLPVNDGQGKHWLSSKEYFERYEADPKGAEARPGHADMWHFLSHAGDSIPWNETSNERTKTVPICTAMFAEPVDLTEDQITASRKLLEAEAGQPIPDTAWIQFARTLRKRPEADRRCIQEINTVLNKHGVEHEKFGRMLLVTLRVSH